MLNDGETCDGETCDDETCDRQSALEDCEGYEEDSVVLLEVVLLEVEQIPIQVPLVLVD